MWFDCIPKEQPKSLVDTLSLSQVPAAKPALQQSLEWAAELCQKTPATLQGTTLLSLDDSPSLPQLTFYSSMELDCAETAGISLMCFFSLMFFACSWEVRQVCAEQRNTQSLYVWFLSFHADQTSYSYFPSKLTARQSGTWKSFLFILIQFWELTMCRWQILFRTFLKMKRPFSALWWWWSW